MTPLMIRLFQLLNTRSRCSLNGAALSDPSYKANGDMVIRLCLAAPSKSTLPASTCVMPRPKHAPVASRKSTGWAGRNTEKSVRMAAEKREYMSSTITTTSRQRPAGSVHLDRQQYHTQSQAPQTRPSGRDEKTEMPSRDSRQGHGD